MAHPKTVIREGGLSEIEKIVFHIGRYERAIAQCEKPARKRQLVNELRYWQERRRVWEMGPK